tara:strand:- start:121 stop:348 length:228 start_codon:yes stop_codon:yes gene_type:complete
MSKTKEAEVWLRTGDTLKALGIGRNTLYRRRREGFLEPNKHWIRSGPSSSHQMLWNISACREVFGTWKAPKGGEG